MIVFMSSVKLKYSFCLVNRTKSTFGQSHDPLLRTTQTGFILWRLHRKGRMKFLELFGRLKSVVIGMIHVKALPGNRVHLSASSRFR